MTSTGRIEKHQNIQPKGGFVERPTPRSRKSTENATREKGRRERIINSDGMAREKIVQDDDHFHAFMQSVQGTSLENDPTIQELIKKHQETCIQNFPHKDIPLKGNAIIENNLEYFLRRTASKTSPEISRTSSQVQVNESLAMDIDGVNQPFSPVFPPFFDSFTLDEPGTPAFMRHSPDPFEQHPMGNIDFSGMMETTPVPTTPPFQSAESHLQAPTVTPLEQPKCISTEEIFRQANPQ